MKLPSKVAVEASPFRVILLQVLLFFAVCAAHAQNKTLIVLFDGMRADYIQPELMPELWAFRQSAARAEQHHSVFPTLTRVNSASFATGAYPGTHGILGNSVYFPAVNPAKSIGTTYDDLSRIAQAESGEILTSPSVGEVLDQNGKRIMVFSSGTTGQAFLQNHKVGRGAILNPGLILPASFREKVLAELGDPEQVATGLNKHKWVTDGLLRYSLVKGGPEVSTIWFSDPDAAGHKAGIGSEELKIALAFVDAQFGRILKHLDANGLRHQYNIIATMDHGFVTYTGQQSISDLLIQEGIKKSKDSDDVIFAGGTIYVKNRDERVIRQIVELFHKTPWIGAIFTKGAAPGRMEGWVLGTFSFESVRYDHPGRVGDILVAVNWTDEKNAFGYAGSDFSMGTAGHGGTSPYEIGIRLFAQGPNFRKGYVSNSPSSIIDIMPTVLHISGIAIPSKMNGRVLSELLNGTDASSSVPNHEVLVVEASYSWGTYKLRLDQSSVGKYRYFNFSKTERVLK
jgi:predicted AlkP superfamily pyrophosphatase or phosphodiesterase